MTSGETDIGRASEADIDGIVELQAANQPGRGGMLSASLPRSRIVEMMREMPLIVARRGDRITGFLMTSTRAVNTDVPIILKVRLWTDMAFERDAPKAVRASTQRSRRLRRREQTDIKGGVVR